MQYEVTITVDNQEHFDTITMILAGLGIDYNVDIDTITKITITSKSAAELSALLKVIDANI